MPICSPNRRLLVHRHPCLTCSRVLTRDGPRVFVQLHQPVHPPLHPDASAWGWGEGSRVGDDGGAPTDAQFGDAPGDGDALERLSAQMQDQQRQISMLLNQQAQVMEAIAKLTDVKATKQEKETGRMTVS